MLEIKKINVTYPDGTKAIRDFSLSVKDGEKVALIGGNGAGKTSLIMALVGILESEGSIELLGSKLSKKTLGEIRQKIGVVFQNPDDQLFMSSIYDDIAFGLRNAGQDEITVEKKVDECLRGLGIDHLKNATALKLSGGERRMAAMATVLVMDPAMMIFDEPTAFLDPLARRRLINTINELDKSMIIATHDMTFAAETCQKVILLKEGELFCKGSVADVLWDKTTMEQGGVEAIGVDFAIYEKGLNR